MPRALLFFNAHRGQCQKRRRLKVITRRSSAEVRSSGVSVGGDGRKWGWKKNEEIILWAMRSQGGSCRGQVRPSRTAHRQISGSAASLIHVLVDRGVRRAAAGSTRRCQFARVN